MTVDPQSRARTTWRTVVAILAAIPLFSGGCAGDSGPEGETVAAETTTTTSPTTTAPPSTAPATTTTTTEAADPPADLSALQEMVDTYHEAYNSGDAAAAFALLSPLSPEVSPANLEFWVESLGEQVAAECVPSLQVENGLMCVERYRDELHGPAGETIRATFHYFESNGVLGRLHDRFELHLGDCVDSRCAGDILDASGGNEVIWSYETFEADLFSWLEQSSPEVARSIGEAANLSYFRRKSEAVSTALPYVEEFVAQSETWPRVSGQRDLANMSVLEAVLAEHEAFNSHDPDAFEAWYGRPPDDVVAWFWGFGTRYESECATTADPSIVECSSRLEDSFYTKAGGVFEQDQLWTTSGNELILLDTAGVSSHWVWYDFEQDMKAWMEQAYPDVAAQIFAGSRIIHDGESATIAMDYIDELLEASNEYPRGGDAPQEAMEMVSAAHFTN